MGDAFLMPWEGGDNVIRGTTPTHIFTIPFEVSLAKEVRVTYGQDDNVIVTKTEEDCDLSGNQIKLMLTQADTFLFDSKRPVQIQLRILTVDNKVMASKVKTVDVLKCLDSEVLA